MAKGAIKAEIDIDVGGKKLKTHAREILAVVWCGMFGYEAFANIMLPEDLFVLVVLGLVIGAGLTFGVLWYALKVTELFLAPKDRK
jgi:hypothetical protein